LYERFTFKALYWKSCKKEPEGHSPRDLEMQREEKQLYKLIIQLTPLSQYFLL
jgi:hypothetical protein